MNFRNNLIAPKSGKKNFMNTPLVCFGEEL